MTRRRGGSLPAGAGGAVVSAPGLPARYRPIEVVGRGGMAEVLLVEDLAGEPRRKAIKILHADLPAALVTAFRDEFRILTSLDHPGLARVFDFGTLADGRTFYAAEFVGGRPLHEAAGRPVKDVCLALGAVCRTLGYLHTRGYVHNDVKPSNILVGEKAGAARLLDLGLAGIARRAGRQVAGTPGYVAPERLAGRAWDERADLFAVGATLFRVLAGRRVAAEEDPAKALRALEAGVPPLGTLRPDVPPALGALVARLLALDPARRPRRAEEVVLALAEAIGEAIPLETPETARCYALSSLFVGRDAELGALVAALADAAERRSTAVRALGGGPGLGKTRLLHEAVWRAETEGWRVAFLDGGAASLANDPLRRIAAQIGLGEGKKLAAAASDLADRLGASLPKRTLVAVDDAHAAADALWASVFALAAAARRRRVPFALFVAFDPERLSPAAHNWLAVGAVQPGTGLRRINLPPLPSRAVGTLLSSLFGPGVIPEALAADVVRRAAGSPLLVGEIVRELVETEALRAGPHGWTLRRASAPARASSRLEDFLRRRTAALRPGALAALRALSALGVGARAEALAEVAGNQLDARVALAELVDHGLAIGAGDSFALASDALASVAWDGVSGDERRAWFRRAAQRLGSDGASDAALARVFGEASEPVETLRHALAAGREALAAGEGERAIGLLEQARAAAETAGARPGEFADLLRDLGSAYTMTGRFAQALASFDRALSLLSSGDPVLRVRVAGAAVLAAERSLDFDAARRWFELAEAAAPRGDALTEARVHRMSAGIAMRQRRLAEARVKWRAELDALARAPDGPDARELRVNALASFAATEGSFDPGAAEDLARSAITAAEHHGDRYLVARAFLNASFVSAVRGRWNEAAQRASRASDLAQEIGGFTLLPAALANLATAEAALGRGEAGLAHLAHAREVATALGYRALNLACERARIAHREADAAGLSRAAAMAIADAAEHPSFAEVLFLAAADAAEIGDGARLADIAARADAEQAASPLDRFWVRLVCAYALAARDPRGGGLELERIVDAMSQGGFHQDEAPVLRDAGRWLARGGDREGAARCLARARRIFSRDGCEPGWRRIDELSSLLREGVVPLPGRRPSDPLSRLRAARSTADLRAALPESCAAAGLAGTAEILLLDGTDAQGAATTDGTGEAALRAAAAAALRAGTPCTWRELRLYPVRGQGTRACVTFRGREDRTREGAIADAVEAAVGAIAAGVTRAAPPAVAGSTERSTVAASPLQSALAPAEALDLELTVGTVATRMRPAMQSSGRRAARAAGLVGRSEPVQRVLALLDRLAPGDAPVLVLGESGTGKEIFARALHAAGPRAGSPFVAVNCAAIPAPLFESELFGHERGAFSGAAEARPGLLAEAHGGTLFLDEIGELPPVLQPKLLRALEERRVRPLGGRRDRAVDFRLCCASNRDLAAETGTGRFRADLYFRIAVVEVRLPPLRDRLADLPVLARHLLDRAGLANPVATGALRALLLHRWPGNVRELENELRRAAALAGTGPIEVEHLSSRIARAATKLLPVAGPGTLADRLAVFEREVLKEALRDARGNQTRAAAALGLTRQGLRLTLRRVHIDPRRFRAGP